MWRIREWNRLCGAVHNTEHSLRSLYMNHVPIDPSMSHRNGTVVLSKHQTLWSSPLDCSIKASASRALLINPMCLSGSSMFEYCTCPFPSHDIQDERDSRTRRTLSPILATVIGHFAVMRKPGMLYNTHSGCKSTNYTVNFRFIRISYPTQSDDESGRSWPLIDP